MPLIALKEYAKVPQEINKNIVYMLVSYLFAGEISPKPTVVIVTTPQ
jgi:hypothetical protein